MEDLQPTPEESARIKAENILSTLAAKTSFGAVPKILQLGQKRVDEIINAASSRNVLDSSTLIKLFNACSKEAETSDTVFDGISIEQQHGIADKQIYAVLKFTVPRCIQIFDVFSEDKIYRIPYSVFHPVNIKIKIHICMMECRIVYRSLSLFKQDDTPLDWIHVFESRRGELCLGTLTSTFTNVGLDGMFLTKLLSSLEILNLRSPARGFVDSALEPEYRELSESILDHSYRNNWVVISE